MNVHFLFQTAEVYRPMFLSLSRLSQVLKGAVGTTICQNEADVKCQMDIDSHISLTLNKQGKSVQSV